MAREQLGSVLQFIRSIVHARGDGDTTDADLVERFATAGDEGAFTALLQRHGPLVLGVCRRVLGNADDADDAFQATFLVLVRRARTIRKRGSVACWLHGVANRVSLEARTRVAQRRLHEQRAESATQTEPRNAAAARELRLILDEELAFLPAKYRSPLVLHYLAGKTKEETARQLGWSEGTVSGRLARARDLLRGRLARRGLTLSVGMLGMALAEQAGVAAVSPVLTESALKIAALFVAGQVATSARMAQITDLAEGALKAMFMSARKVATLVVLVVTFVGLGAGAWIYAAYAGQPEPQPTPAQGAAKPVAGSKVQLAGTQPKRDETLLRVPLPDRTMMTVTLSANGKLLAIAPHDKTTVQLWDVASAKEQTLTGNPFSVTAMAFSPDGKTLATGTGSWLPDSAPGEIKLWDVATGKERVTLDRLPQMILALTFSPDGKTLASASKTAKLWDVTTGKEKCTFNPNYGHCFSIAFAPDGKLLAVGVGEREDDTPGVTLLYDVGTEKVRATLTGHKGMVACVAFAPDGKTLASGDSRGTLKLWDVATAKERLSIPTPAGTFESFSLQSFAFAADGKAVASTMMLESGYVLKEWDAADGTERTVYQGTAKDFPLVVSADARIVGLAGPTLEGPLVKPGGKLELRERQSLSRAIPK